MAKSCRGPVWGVICVGSLALVLAASPGAASITSCFSSFEEDIFVPTKTETPVGPHEVLEATEQAVIVHDPVPGASYRVSPRISVSGCTAPVCLFGPDPNVVWFDAQGDMVAHHQESGHWQEGSVPEGAAKGLIYYRALPYYPTLPVDAQVFTYSEAYCG